jgi:hypothetical protein
MELIKQIEAILEGQKTAAERQSPQHSAYGRTYRLMGDARFELASLRKNG